MIETIWPLSPGMQVFSSTASSRGIACCCHLYQFNFSLTVQGLCTLVSISVNVPVLAGQLICNCPLWVRCQLPDITLLTACQGLIPFSSSVIFLFFFIFFYLFPLLSSSPFDNIVSSYVHQAVEEFLGVVRSREQPHSAGLVSQPTAVKFLMARKFDVSRAIELFQAYKVQHCFKWWLNRWNLYFLRLKWGQKCQRRYLISDSLTDISWI